MYALHHDCLSTSCSLSSSSSTPVAQNNFNVVRKHIVSVPSKKVVTTKCVATSPEGDHNVDTITLKGLEWFPLSHEKSHVVLYAEVVTELGVNVEDAFR
ncbi:hypothetical protein Tco_0984582 [Tanacetum coccineum]